jgi:hypothetical protein
MASDFAAEVREAFAFVEQEYACPYSFEVTGDSFDNAVVFFEGPSLRVQVRRERSHISVEVATAPVGTWYDLPLVLRWLGENTALKDSDPPMAHSTRELATILRQHFPRIQEALHPKHAATAAAELEALKDERAIERWGPLST